MASDVFLCNIPAAAVLVEEGSLDNTIVETCVVRKGGRDVSSREGHEAILFLGVLLGLLSDPESLSLNQKVGGTSNDMQREAGGERLR